MYLYRTQEGDLRACYTDEQQLEYLNIQIYFK